MYELFHGQRICFGMPRAFTKSTEPTGQNTDVRSVDMEVLIEIYMVIKSSGFDHVCQCAYRRQGFMLKQKHTVFNRDAGPVG